MKLLILACSLALFPLACRAAVAPDNPTEKKFDRCLTPAELLASQTHAATDTNGMALLVSDESAHALGKAFNTANRKKIVADHIGLVVAPSMPRAVLAFVKEGKACSIWSMPALTLERWIMALPTPKPTAPALGDTL